MSPVVRINDATFVDLKQVSTWLGTDTPSETIDTLVREKMVALDLERDVGETVDTDQNGSAPLAFEKTPGLTFTRIISASIEGKQYTKVTWAQLLLSTIEIVKDKGIEGDDLVRELQIPSRADEYIEEGYKYHSNLGISVQGQSAQDAWREVSRLADKYQIPVEVKFQWRENKKAQHPGEVGVIQAAS